MWEQNDVSGRCTVEYKAAQGQVTRTKNLETCKTAESGFTTHSQVCQHPDQLTVLKYECYWITIELCFIVSSFRSWAWARSPVLLQCSLLKMVSSARPWLKRHTHWPSTPADLPQLKSCPGTVNACATSECVLPFLLWAHFNFRNFFTGKPSHWLGQRPDHWRLLGKMWLGLSSPSMPNLLPLVLWRRRSNPSAKDVHQWVPVHFYYVFYNYIMYRHGCGLQRIIPWPFLWHHEVECCSFKWKISQLSDGLP